MLKQLPVMTRELRGLEALPEFLNIMFCFPERLSVSIGEIPLQ